MHDTEQLAEHLDKAIKEATLSLIKLRKLRKQCGDLSDSVDADKIQQASDRAAFDAWFEDLVWAKQVDAVVKDRLWRAWRTSRWTLRRACGESRAEPVNRLQPGIRIDAVVPEPGSDEDREAFEEWAKQFSPWLDDIRRDGDRDTYANPHLQTAWLAWTRKSQTETAAGPS